MAIKDFTIANASVPVLRTNDDNFGPYELDCSNALPSGVTISSATSSTFKRSGSSYASATSIVEPDSITITADQKLQFKLQHNSVGAGYYYIKFKLTLSSGTKNVFFGPIIVDSIT